MLISQSNRIAYWNLNKWSRASWWRPTENLRMSRLLLSVNPAKKPPRVRVVPLGMKMKLFSNTKTMLNPKILTEPTKLVQQFTFRDFSAKTFYHDKLHLQGRLLPTKTPIYLILRWCRLHFDTPVSCCCQQCKRYRTWSTNKLAHSLYTRSAMHHYSGVEINCKFCLGLPKVKLFLGHREQMASIFHIRQVY